jgi:hypothetical protein
MRLVHQALCDACEESAERGRRNSAETVLGYSTSGPFDSPIGAILKNLAVYADSHHQQYGSRLADDYILGVSWRRCLSGVRELLNGETGRLDCGDVDRAILAMYTAAGFEGDEP